MAIRRKYGIIFTLSLLLCVAFLFMGISFSSESAYADEQVYPTQMNRAELPFSRLSGFYADFKNNISNKNMSVSETLYGIDLSIEKASGTMYPYWTKGSSNYFTIRIGNQVKVKATNGDRVYGLCLNGRTSLNATSSDTNLTKGEPKIVVTANTGEVVINGHYIGWTGNASEVIFTFSLGPNNTNTYATYEFDKIVMWSSSENIPTPSEPTVKGDVSALVAGMNTADAKTVYFGQGSTYHYPENPEVAPLAWKVVGYNGEGVASKPGTMTLMADEIFFYDLYVDRNYDYGGTTSGREKHPYGVSNAHKRLTEIAGTFSNAEKNAIYERALFDTLQAAYDAKLWMPSESEVYQLHESIRSTKTFSTRTYTATSTGKGSLITYGSSGWGANSIYYGNDHYIRPMVMIDLSKVESVSEGSDGIFTFNFVQPPHAHNWEYELSSDGEKLIAACSEQGCPSNVQELFLDILDKNYDKLATNAIINTNNWQANDLLDVSGIAVKYVGVNGTNYAETTTAPENAGTYKAKLTVGDYTIEKQYTISPISVSIPSGMPPEYADVELFRTLNPQSYEIQWWMGKAETYSGNKNVVYDGNAHAVVYTQTSTNNGVDWGYSYMDTTGGKIVFSVGDMDGPWTINPTITDAGVHKVYWKIEASNGNYIGTEADEDNFIYGIIEQAESVITTAPTAKSSLVYNGTAQNLINAGSVNGGYLVYKLGANGSYSANIPQATNAGEYDVYYKVYSDGNYSGIVGSESNKVRVTIAKGQSVVTSAPTAKTTLTFNGSLQTLINAGETNGGELVYKLGESGTYSSVLPQALNAGEYEVYYKVLGNDNLNGIEESSQNKVVITIAKAVRPQMPALSKQSLTDTTVTLNQITGIEDGEIEYGYCLTENGEFVYGNSNVITSLDDNQTYYFRYRVLNSANYEVYVSSAISAKTNSSDVTAPQITGVNEQDRYCTAQTLTIIEDNLLFVKVDGIDVTANLVDGKITLGVKNEAQVVLVSDIAGNTATVTVKIFGHEESAWIVDSAPKIGQNGEKHTECLHCGESIKTAQIDALVANAEQDANVQKQDPVIEQNAPATEIKNNISEIRESVLTTEDEEAIANGATINVYIEVKVITESVEQETINKVVEKVGANVDVVYLDLSLFKKVGEEIATSVHELNKKIKISVVVPDSIKAEGRTYQIVRVHDGVAEIISGEYNEQSGEFTFETDRFSTYALTYVPEKASINSGLIIGIIVGGVVLAGIAVGIVLILNKRKKA